ncbi:MAG: helix-turn-helix transcriptional regulator [Bacteroidota bacterium]
MAKKQDDTQKELDPRIQVIAKKLERIRVEKGYSSYENFAIEFGISRMQYWRMEKGTNFTFTSLLKILDAHKMTLSEFFKDIT